MIFYHFLNISVFTNNELQVHVMQYDLTSEKFAQLYEFRFFGFYPFQNDISNYGSFWMVYKEQSHLDQHCRNYLS